MNYTLTAVLGVLVAVLIDCAAMRTVLITRRAFWLAYAIMLFFQLIVNGLLTGLKIVRYDPNRIIGLRIAYAPVEDIAFGFAMVLITLSLWVRLGRGARSESRRDRPWRGDATPPRHGR